LPTIYVETFPF